MLTQEQNTLIENQSREFDAVATLATAFHNLPAIVDDDYPRMRHQYEHAVRELIIRFRENGRIESPT